MEQNSSVRKRGIKSAIISQEEDPNSIKQVVIDETGRKDDVSGEMEKATGNGKTGAQSKKRVAVDEMQLTDAAFGVVKNDAGACNGARKAKKWVIDENYVKYLQNLPPRAKYWEWMY